MLFNSPLFIFIFLPITVLGFYLIGSQGFHKAAVSWLVGASFFFYGYWNPPYVLLLLGSILFNYASGISLSKKQRKGILAVGVTANLGLLGYFKHSNAKIEL
jgi:alginate O-acetyltransferase complex protein AlgI